MYLSMPTHAWVGIFYADNTNNLVYNNFEILFSFF